ncbi:MAG: nicotinate phosphoribosyltransferase [Candidatus Caldarchaeum sp.]|nr:nicotinate phosphoribosyltransferase [Candidatus Caldarchaeum sp.]
MKRNPMPYSCGLEKIRSGEVTDIYFQRTKTILERSGSSEVRVAAEIHSYGFPAGYDWAVFTGLEEVLWLLEGIPVDLYAMDEGTLFKVMEPVSRIEGRYVDFAVYEPSILGMIRHSTSVSTKAARVKLAADGRPVLFFGIRSVHPAIAPMVDRAAYLGGCDAVSGVVGATMMGLDPMGTMPHALILVLADEVKAWRLFDEVMPENVPRIALVDTFYDERQESIRAAETLGKKLYGVRLDTPGSRRGNMRKIVEETRWTLSIKGFPDVKIFVSGGLAEENIKDLADIVDGFGVGTSIAFPESVDLALDIVERGGQPMSKRGKLPGKKQVYRCEKMHDVVTVWGKHVDSCPVCGGPCRPLLKQVMAKGEVIVDLPSAKKIRDYVLEQLDRVGRLGDFAPRPILFP